MFCKWRVKKKKKIMAQENLYMIVAGRQSLITPYMGENKTFMSITHLPYGCHHRQLLIAELRRLQKEFFVTSGGGGGVICTFKHKIEDTKFEIFRGEECTPPLGPSPEINTMHWMPKTVENRAEPKATRGMFAISRLVKVFTKSVNTTKFADCAC